MLKTWVEHVDIKDNLESQAEGSEFTLVAQYSGNGKSFNREDAHRLFFLYMEWIQRTLN